MDGNPTYKNYEFKEKVYPDYPREPYFEDTKENVDLQGLAGRLPPGVPGDKTNQKGYVINFHFKHDGEEVPAGIPIQIIDKKDIADHSGWFFDVAPQYQFDLDINNDGIPDMRMVQGTWGATHYTDPVFSDLITPPSEPLFRQRFWELFGLG